MDRLPREHELTLGFSEDALANEMSRRDTRCTLDVIIETIRRDRKLVGVERNQSLFAEMLFDETTQRFDR